MELQVHLWIYECWTFLHSFASGWKSWIAILQF